MSKRRLSKSKYMSGLQCELRLWNECHEPELWTEPDEATAARFAVGADVGRLATNRYHGGIQIHGDYPEFKDALARTSKAVADTTVPAIFDATFQHEDVLAASFKLVAA